MLRDKLVGGNFGNVCKTHSRRMGAIRGSGNKTTEARFRAMLVRAGIRGWTMQTKGIKGRPDFYFSDSKVAVFLDGCFWHGCPRHYTAPRHNAAFWIAKVEGNRARDERQDAALRAEGWRVVRLWECEVASDLSGAVARVAGAMYANGVCGVRRVPSRAGVFPRNPPQE